MSTFSMKEDLKIQEAITAAEMRSNEKLRVKLKKANNMLAFCHGYMSVGRGETTEQTRQWVEEEESKA